MVALARPRRTHGKKAVQAIAGEERTPTVFGVATARSGIASDLTLSAWPSQYDVAAAVSTDDDSVATLLLQLQHMLQTHSNQSASQSQLIKLFEAVMIFSLSSRAVLLMIARCIGASAVLRLGADCESARAAWAFLARPIERQGKLLRVSNQPRIDGS